MFLIKKIHDESIPLIAAGEVIIDVASIVKELVENSIDAGATKIQVELCDEKDLLLRVTDNGCGMSVEDLASCTLFHYTSKLQHVQDLSNLKTLGFRGEGLSSICAVSEVCIKSRTSDQDHGYILEVKNNILSAPIPIGMPVGTVVEVKNLFESIPARKKFLSEPSLEYRKTLDILTALVLGNPSIGMSLYRNGKKIFSFGEGTPIRDILWWFLGTKHLANTINLESTSERVTTLGYVFKPQVSSYNKDNQFIFVNNRYVQDGNISRAVKDAFGTLLDVKSYPPFLLYLFLDANLLDINVHPQKTFVRFWDEKYIYDHVYGAVLKALDGHNLTYTGDYSSDIFGFPAGALTYTFNTLKDSTQVWSPRDLNSDDATIQIANTYIAVPVSTGVMLIDQHAAHESILYNQFLEEFKHQRSEKSKFILSKAVTVDLSISEMDLLQDKMNLLESIGFEMDVFGDTTVKISSVPALFQSHNIENLLRELLSDFKKFGFLKDIDENTRKTIAYLSCRGAIKSGDKLSSDERLNLVKKLGEEHFLYTCPHGRPVKILISLYDLGKMFKRLK